MVSFEVFTQLPPQLVSPESQSTPQAPPLHTAVARLPAAQALPHLPQLARSRLVSTQLPPQALNPL
jgi:hypothetical protein